MQWISVEDRMPPISLCDDLLVVCASTVTFASWDGEYWRDCDGDFFQSGAITHWMPLPDPPVEKCIIPDDAVWANRFEKKAEG